MLAKLVKVLPEGPEWEYELKLDGYRLEAVKDREKGRLYSRNGNDFTRRFSTIAKSVSRIKAASVVLDGEAVAVAEIRFAEWTSIGVLRHAEFAELRELIEGSSL
jgi:bifunctional non-homologous end joining protein LigD